MKMDTDNTDQIRSDIHQLTCEARQAKTTKEAVVLYEEAYKKSRQLDEDKIERICALNLGAAHIEDENPQAGLEYLHKATPAVGTSERDDLQSTGDLNFNKAFANEKLGRYEVALEFFEKARDDYVSENNGTMRKQCCLKMAQMFCDMATKMRADPKMLGKAEETADQCLKLNLHDMALEKSECIDASKILNELGLLYTQLQSYDKATQCFEKAVELCRQGGPTQNQQLMAVLLQNLGAGYNFQGDYQRSIKFHEDAEKKYTKIGNYRIGRNGQGQCFMNLAYAYCQLEGGASERAFQAFTEAKKAADDTDDRHMLWQAFEGLGAVSFNQGNYSESADKYREAVQRISDPDNSKRVADKLEIALQYKMAQRSGRIPTNYTTRPSMPIQQLQPTQTQQMQSTLSGTQERQIIPHVQSVTQAQIPAQMFAQIPAQVPAQIPTQMPAAQQNMMSSLRMQPAQPVQVKRGKVRVRKHDSIGPHLPKVAQGFGSLSHRGSMVVLNNDGFRVDSPRYQGVTSGLETSHLTEEEEESETEDSGTDESTDDDDETESKQSVNSPKVEEIFRRGKASKSQASPARDGTVSDTRLRKYASMLEEKEANEDDKDEEDSEEEDSSDEDESTDDDSDDSESTQKAPLAPPIPAHSPPSSAPNTTDLGTYINSNINNDSSSKSESQRQNGRHGESPRATTSDNEPPYATIGTIKRNGDDTSAGNTMAMDDISKPKQAKLHARTKHKSANFFDTDDSDDEDVGQVKGGSGGFRMVKNEQEENEDEDDRDKLGNLPRGQRENILHEEHLRRQREEQPPPLPDRKDPKSKACVIM